MSVTLLAKLSKLLFGELRFSLSLTSGGQLCCVQTQAGYPVGVSPPSDKTGLVRVLLEKWTMHLARRRIKLDQRERIGFIELSTA
ncbi:UNVERIFIED_CONTAM: hypothetical protein Sradi_7252200 [Sesamum radiatum]|uniref:Uncharacterized protein n=1 Tax=Sesamum radiatum TaxID=300843 RepID=A0AAW2ILV7_SESRA